MTYPSFLPLPVRDGYTGQIASTFKRTQMEDGQFRQRRMWNSQQFHRNISWRLSFEQAQMFEAWVEYTLGMGTGEFDLPIRGVNHRVSPVTGVPVYSFEGGYWLVSMAVKEIQGPPVISAPGALPLWPQDLPELESTGFTISQTGAVTVSDIDSGLPEMRVRFKDRVAFYNGQLIMSGEQLDQFWLFYRNDLINGNAWFMAPFASPDTQELRKGRFISSPVETPNGSYFNVAVSLETVNLPIMSFEEYNSKAFQEVYDYYEPGYILDGYIGRYV